MPANRLDALVIIESLRREGAEIQCTVFHAGGIKLLRGTADFSHHLTYNLDVCSKVTETLKLFLSSFLPDSGENQKVVLPLDIEWLSWIGR